MNEYTLKAYLASMGIPQVVIDMVSFTDTEARTSIREMNQRIDSLESMVKSGERLLRSAADIQGVQIRRLGEGVDRIGVALKTLTEVDGIHGSQLLKLFETQSSIRAELEKLQNQQEKEARREVEKRQDELVNCMEYVYQEAACGGSRTDGIRAVLRALGHVK